MDAVDLRYSAGAKLRDSLVGLAIALVLGTVLAPLVYRFLPRDELGLAGLLALYAGCWIPAVVVAGLWRWGKRGRVDAESAAVSLSPRGPVASVAWSEVGEIFALRPRGVELRAGEQSVRLTDEFDGVEAVDPLVALRSAAIEADLLRSWTAGATLRFRGPMEPRQARASGLALAFILAPTILLPLGFVSFRFSSGISAFVGASIGAVVLSAWMALLLAISLSVRARACGWLEAGPDGLQGRPAWRSRTILWDEIESVERGRDGGLTLRLKAGGSISVPSDWSNLGAFAAIVRARIQA